MSRILSSIYSDPSGAFFAKYDNFFIVFSRILSTYRMRVIMLSRKIQFGRNCVFYGITYIRRGFQSSITIGNGCRFRSSFLSNNVGLNRSCFISTLRKKARIIIGDNVGMSGTVIGCAESITIGNNVLLGGNTFITDFDWHPLPGENNTQAESKPVIIEDNVFIGLNAIILKGSHIGRGSVIGANSVVAGIIPAGVIAAGNPCKILKQINSEQ